MRESNDCFWSAAAIGRPSGQCFPDHIRHDDDIAALGLGFNGFIRAV